mgnify:CR=1 FL=1
MKHISFQEHRELGNVTWLRDFDAALREATTSGKAIVLLFQEVPGCSTCVNFGHDVLSHPLLVELIEECFVPVAIFNNHSGEDARVLRAFNEPAWNNPVVYFLDADGKPLLPKLSNRYDPVGLYDRLNKALDVQGKQEPTYARLLRGDLMIENGQAASAVYETPCIWSGETTLAGHEGVLSTEAGWVGGEEVVKVHFDPALVSQTSLDSFALTEGFRRSNRRNFRVDEAPQYYLSKTSYAGVPLSPAQRTRINLAIPYREDPAAYLSPRQFKLLRALKPETMVRSAYRGQFREEWAHAMARVADCN